MNEPIRTLRDEHRTIERGLDALDRYASDAASLEQGAVQDDILGFVEFIKLFADRIHHGKEEEILFERMVATGFPRGSGPLAVMYHEHDQARAFVAELEVLGKRNEQWSDVERQQLLNTARGYTSLLRSHIHKEDNILYPMAENGLNPDAWDLIARRFEQFEEDERNSGEKARLVALAEELAIKYGEKAA